MELLVQPSSVSADVPFYATPSSAGLDVRCVRGFTLEPGQRTLVGTGYRVEVKDSLGTHLIRRLLRLFGWDIVYQMEVRPRSGLALKNGVTVLNSPGTIDEDYRGEIGIILINHSDTAVGYTANDRVAQLVVGTALRPKVRVVNQLRETIRGAGGFGSTGTK